MFPFSFPPMSSSSPYLHLSLRPTSSFPSFSLSTLRLTPHGLLPPLYLQLSFIVRIVPSPDWFVGVDSFDLCDGDHWKENVSLELFPYDAGTDSGFTFSSPNFETIPQDRITQVGRPEPSETSTDPKLKLPNRVNRDMNLRRLDKTRFLLYKEANSN